MPLASFRNLVGPDLIVIAIMMVVLLVIPFAIALPIVFMIDRRKKRASSASDEIPKA